MPKVVKQNVHLQHRKEVWTSTSLEVGEKSKVSILEVVALWGNVGIFPQSMGHIDI